MALVTGATRGIGRATAVRLAEEGALVGVNHRASGDPSETLTLIEEAGGKGFAVEADMRDPAQVVAMVKEVARVGGRFDYLVSNAAINPLLTWDETTLEDYDRIQETNLRGTWVVCQAAARQMIEEGHGGAIATVSSISAWVSAAMTAARCRAAWRIRSASASTTSRARKTGASSADRSALTAAGTPALRRKPSLDGPDAIDQSSIQALAE